MDRTKQLETAIEKAIEWLGTNSAPCVTNARQVLRAALTPAEKGPLTCPNCGGPLSHDSGTGEWVCFCALDHVGTTCQYSQPDSAQRPPYPSPREGYHAGEFRIVEEGETYFSLLGGIVICTERTTVKRWIAVPDAPVSEPVPYGCCSCKHQKTPSGEGRCAKCNNDFIMYEPAPSPVKAPVVLYFREAGGRKRVVKTRSDYTIIEEIVNGVVSEAKQDSWRIMPRHFEAITLTEYEAARKPAKTALDWPGKCPHCGEELLTSEDRGLHCDGCDDLTAEDIEAIIAKHTGKGKPAIEPLWNPANDRTIAKVNELIARVNALEGGGK